MTDLEAVKLRVLELEEALERMRINKIWCDQCGRYYGHDAMNALASVREMLRQPHDPR